MRWLPSPLLSSRPSRAERDSGVLQPMGMADPHVEVGEPRGVVCDGVDGGLRPCGPGVRCNNPSVMVRSLWAT